MRHVFYVNALSASPKVRLFSTLNYVNDGEIQVRIVIKHIYELNKHKFCSLTRIFALV